MVETTYATLEAWSLFIAKYTLLPDGMSLPFARKEPLKMPDLQSMCIALWVLFSPVLWISPQRRWPADVLPGVTEPGAVLGGE